MDHDLNELDTLDPIVIHATEDDLSRKGDFARDIHTKTGLLQRVKVSSTTRRVVEAQLAKFDSPALSGMKSAPADGSRYCSRIIGEHRCHAANGRDHKAMADVSAGTRAPKCYRSVGLGS